MNVLITSLKNNRFLLGWFSLFLIFLLCRPPIAGSTNILNAVWDYWASGEWHVLLAALAATLTVALPVSIIILLVSLCCACLSYFRSKASPFITLFMAFSLLPTVYLIFLLKALFTHLPVDNKLFLIVVLSFSNLILFFFFMGFRKELHEEFGKEYHALARMLGVSNVLSSAAKKIGLILMERFRPLFVLVFSSTVFAEHKLDVAGGIYSLLYKTTTTVEGRMDIFYGQLLFILLFVVFFLVVYDILITLIKKRYY
jgi:hypothetical protein